MKRLPTSPLEIVTWLLNLAFGGLFIWSGLMKILGIGPMTFADDIRSFHLINDPYVAVVAMTLPAFEILCGLAVILGVLRTGGLLLLNICLVVFLFALGQAWYRGIDISCGCFGHSNSHPAPWELILRDIGLLLVGLWLLFRQRPSSSHPT